MAEHHLAPRRRGCGVHVDHDRVRDPLDGGDGAFDEIASCRSEHDDRHIVGSDVSVGDETDEVEVGL